MRRLFTRESAAPAEVVTRAALARGERVLAAAQAEDGTWLMATRASLVLAPEADPVTAIPWQQVEAADWSRDDDRLRVSEVGEFGQERPSYEFTLTDPGKLLAVIRERVTASVVLQRHVELAGGAGLFVVARRAPTGGDEITWSYEYDAGVDPDDPQVRIAAQRGLRAAAEELGLG